MKKIAETYFYSACTIDIDLILYKFKNISECLKLS